ncbi:acyltransferase family protein [Oenococcus sp.]|uniref:acyltransferase family protein n=1 Tax=Oenococcus sp. TaxID=1979414 RepID=UPI0039EBA685
MPDNRSKRKYIYGVDLMRLLFIVGVLTIHTSTQFTFKFSSGSAPFLFLSALHMPMHFTRMGFMFVSGLVLFLNSYRRPMQLLNFWKRRYFWVLIPYFFWNIFYHFLAHYPEKILTSNWWLQYWHLLIHGSGYYMYFLLIMLQLYLLYPLLRLLLKKTEGKHLQVFFYAFAIEILITVFTKFVMPHLSTSNWPYLLQSYGMFVLTYEGYFIAGALAGIHYEAVEKWIVANIKKIFIAALIGIPVIFAYYFYNVNLLHLSYSKAYEVHQPLIVIYAFIVIANIFYVGHLYDQLVVSNKHPKFVAFISKAQKIAFGLYLSQTVALTILDLILEQVTTNSAWLWLIWPVATLAVIAFSGLLCWTIYNTPVAHYVIGRPLNQRNKWKSTSHN